MKKHILIALLFFCIFNVNAQLTSSLDVPNQVPSTPEVSKLIGMINYDVNYNTGLSSLEIPLYTIKLKGCELPIKLVYNSSGYKPNETSTVGLGWSLVAEPYIARQVNGLPDERFFWRNFSSLFPLSQENSCELGGYPNMGVTKDGKPDRFFYNLCNKSGSFFTKVSPSIWNNGVIERGFTTYPYYPLKISSDEDFESFKINDIDGTKYSFGKVEQTFASGNTYFSCYKASQIKTKYGEIISFAYDSLKQTLSQYANEESLRLEVLNCNVYSGNEYYVGNTPEDRFGYGDKFNAGTVSFTDVPSSRPSYYYYTTKLIKTIPASNNPNSDYTNTIYHVKRKARDWKAANSLESMFNYTTYSSRLIRTVRTCRCTTIAFPGGSVEFTYSKKDLSSYNKYTLDEVVVKNTDGDVLKDITLNIDCSLERPFLTSVDIKDSNKSNPETYSMDYNLDNSGRLKYDNENSIDVNSWGYYHASSTTYKRIPILETDSIEYEIPYEFDTSTPLDTIAFRYRSTDGYGDHDYYFRKGETITQTSMLTKITYPTGGYTTFQYEPSKFLHSTFKDTLYTGALRIKDIQNYNSNEKLQKWEKFKYGEGDSGLGIATQELTASDFMSSSSTQDWVFECNYSYSGWFKYSDRYIVKFSPTPLITDDLNTSASIVYDNVSKYIVDSAGNTLGKEEYVYDYSNIDNVRSIRENDGYLRNYYEKKYQNWTVGQLIKKNIYKTVNNTLSIIQQQNYEYNSLWYGKKIYELTVYPDYDIDYDVSSKNSCYTNSFEAATPMLFALGMEDDSPQVDFFYPSTICISGDNKLIKQTTTDYTDAGDITKTTSYTYNSNLLPIEVKTKKSNSSSYLIQSNKYPTDYDNDTVNSMVSKNVISPVIDSYTYQDDNLIQHIHNAYEMTSDSLFFKLRESEYGGDNDLISQFNFNKYIQGNFFDFSDKASFHTVYLWGYDNQYPIAEIKNATYSQIESALGSTLINRVATATIPSSSDIATINLLRGSLSDALVTTYTYQPLVGMTSATSPNGVTTYYEYDTFNRLKRTYIIEDGTEKTIQSYDYHYQGE